MILADRSLCHYSDAWCVGTLAQVLVMGLVHPRIRSAIAHGNYLSMHRLKLDLELRMSIAPLR